MIKSVVDSWVDIEENIELLFAGRPDLLTRAKKEIEDVKSLLTAESSVIASITALKLLRTDVRRYPPTIHETETKDRLITEMGKLNAALIAMRELYEHQRKS